MCKFWTCNQISSWTYLRVDTTQNGVRAFCLKTEGCRSAGNYIQYFLPWCAFPLNLVVWLDRSAVGFRHKPYSRLGLELQEVHLKQNLKLKKKKKKRMPSNQTWSCYTSGVILAGYDQPSPYGWPSDTIWQPWIIRMAYIIFKVVRWPSICWNLCIQGSVIVLKVADVR